MALSRAQLTAVAGAAAVAGSAHANTGNFMPMLLSFLIAIPLLLLVPPAVIACRSAYTWKHRSRWAALALLVGAISYGTLWWATGEYSILAHQDWYIIYLWTLPSYAFWVFAAIRMKR